jgi:hypothetical protein
MKQGEQTCGVPLAAATCAIWLRDLLVLARRAYRVITASDQWSRFVVFRDWKITSDFKLVPWPAPHSAPKSLIARQNLKGQGRGCQQ